MTPTGSLRRLARPVLLAALAWPALALVSGGSPDAAAAGDPAAGREKAYTCLGCHGVDRYVNVYPSYHVPYVAGQNQEYLIAALKAYRSGERRHQTMQANAGLLTDEDIDDITAWFASLGRPAP